MNIFYDENMPFVKEFFSDFGNLYSFSGRSLTANDIIKADVLLVRSITQVNETLLRLNNQLQFVGTATIGVDHIDQRYLKQRNVNFSSAAGCNAISVAEYVISALVVMAERYLIDIFSLTVGIVGAGNTGSRLSEKLTALGIKHVLCDPILAQAQLNKVSKKQRDFVTLEKALSCDVISLHVPLTQSGEYPTYHLLNKDNLAKLSQQQVLINACRGDVIDNQALLLLKKQGKGPKLILDVWENEPNILLPLVQYTDIATAHIAGYSLEGKARGTEMLYQALCRAFKKEIRYNLEQFLPIPIIDSITIKEHFSESLLNPLVKTVYDVRRDDAIFRQQITKQGFDYIRKTYPQRREFSALKVKMKNVMANIDTEVDLKQLGFNFSHSLV